MTRCLHFLVVFCLLILLSCVKKKTKTVSTKQVKKLSIEMKTLQKQLGNCEQQDSGCARVDLKYPLIKSAVSVKAQKAINNTILRALMENLVFEELDEIPSESLLSSLADSFLLDWKKAAELDPESNSNAGWEITVKGELGLRNSKVLAVTLAVNSFAGGVHPNSFLTIFNFDLQTGKVLAWEDVVTNLDSLKVLAEEKFMDAHALPPGSSLNEAGYFWDGPFALPQNFELQKEGVFLWYNPYEAASYTEGPTDFLISYKEMGHCSRLKWFFKGWLLSFYLFCNKL